MTLLFTDLSLGFHIFVLVVTQYETPPRSIDYWDGKPLETPLTRQNRLQWTVMAVLVCQLWFFSFFLFSVLATIAFAFLLLPMCQYLTRPCSPQNKWVHQVVFFAKLLCYIIKHKVCRNRTNRNENRSRSCPWYQKVFFTFHLFSFLN